jgi:hypothetical protein
VTPDIAAGWQVYANLGGLDSLIRTTIQVAGVAGVAKGCRTLTGRDAGVSLQ